MRNEKVSVAYRGGLRTVKMGSRPSRDLRAERPIRLDLVEKLQQTGGRS